MRAALLLSVLAHLGALAFWQLPPLPRTLEGRTFLTVILLPPQNASLPKTEQQPLPESTIKEPPAPVPLKPEPSIMELPKTPEPAPSSQQELHVSNAAPAMEEDQPAIEEFRALPADPVAENRNIQTAGQARALLLIGEDGAVRQIIWNQLPAVTDEELRQMEQRLRQKAYLARGGLYTVTETIEVPREQ